MNLILEDGMNEKTSKIDVSLMQQSRKKPEKLPSIDDLNVDPSAEMYNT